ncbi:hypothetical protein BRC91_04230 [Halobacteriales archaeon QS_4_62_28]|nr:MAG: hypothetical protein BRC91_04230 [Halobacteriales archaeon QS_4_62_28]
MARTCEKDGTVTIEVIGAGTVGKATGMVLEKWGNNVVFKDVDESVLISLRNRGYRAKKPSEEVDADLSLICVPTPFSQDDGLSTNHVENAVQTLAKQDPEVVAIRSTVPPGTTERLADIYGIEDYAVIPEFLFEDDALEDIKRCELMVLGSSSTRATETIKRTFKPDITGLIEIRPVEAEIVKLVGNTFAATKISFANEMWRIANNMSGANPNTVLSAFRHISPWMGPDMGLEGGWAYGGHCLPKDIKGFKQWAEEQVKIPTPQLKGTIRENNLMKEFNGVSKTVEAGLSQSVQTDD